MSAAQQRLLALEPMLSLGSQLFSAIMLAKNKFPKLFNLLFARATMPVRIPFYNCCSSTGAHLEADVVIRLPKVFMSETGQEYAPMTVQLPVCKGHNASRHPILQLLLNNECSP